MSGGLKVSHFTVAASSGQSARWKQAAEAEGHRAVGTWLAEAADAYLKARARAGQPLPLAWHRGRFKVILMDGSTVEIHGMVSAPFGEFEGSSHGKRQGFQKRTLVHIPTGKVIATLRTARQCKALASELAPVYARDDATTAGVVERHRREAM
jgi:hypothetical protein